MKKVRLESFIDLLYTSKAVLSFACGHFEPLSNCGWMLMCMSTILEMDAHLPGTYEFIMSETASPIEEDTMSDLDAFDTLNFF